MLASVKQWVAPLYRPFFIKNFHNIVLIAAMSGMLLPDKKLKIVKDAIEVWQDNVGNNNGHTYVILHHIHLFHAEYKIAVRL